MPYHLATAHHALRTGRRRRTCTATAMSGDRNFPAACSASARDAKIPTTAEPLPLITAASRTERLETPFQSRDVGHGRSNAVLEVVGNAQA